MGGGGGTAQPSVITTPRPNDTPLEGPLAGQGQRALSYQEPFSYFGAGYQLAPTRPFAQVQTPGPGQGVPQSGGLLQQMSQLMQQSAPQGQGQTPGQVPPRPAPNVGASLQDAGQVGQQAQPGGQVGGNPEYRPPTINPGQVFPNSAGGGDVPLLPPNPGANQDVRNQFLNPNFTDPYFAQAQAAANLGSTAAQATPAAGNFLTQLFNPKLNQFEQSFLGAGMGNAQKLLEQGMMRVEDQYENNPYHGALPQQQGEVMNQFARDTMSQASQLGLQRQQLATGAVSTPFDITTQQAAIAPQASERLFNMANSAYQEPYKLPLSVYSQIPLASQTLVPGQSQSSGGIKL